MIYLLDSGNLDFAAQNLSGTIRIWLNSKGKALVKLSSQDRAMLAGEMGEAPRRALRIVVKMAEIAGAVELLDVTRAHIDSGILEGQSGLDFVDLLVSKGARVVIPTTINVVSLDLERNGTNRRLSPEYAHSARHLAEAYLKMGVKPTFTCAPYQIKEITPAFGEQVAWAESNAVNYINSVTGARTNKYGDFFDICLALTGRAPACGLHLTANRKGQFLFTLKGLPEGLFKSQVFYQVLGFLVGRLSGELIPVIEGLAGPISEDNLKAFSAAAASSGSVSLFHIIGVTPEAPNYEAAFQGEQALKITGIGVEMLKAAHQELSVNPTGRKTPDVIALGSPHFSLPECRELANLVKGKKLAAGLDFFVATNRAVFYALKKENLVQILEDFGATGTQDTCVVVSPLISHEAGLLMTNSAKYAYYAPGILKLPVVFGSLEECVETAVRGELVRFNSFWN